MHGGKKDHMHVQRESANAYSGVYMQHLQLYEIKLIQNSNCMISDSHSAMSYNATVIAPLPLRVLM